MKIIKWLVITIIALAIIIFITLKFLSESKPDSRPGESADKLAMEVMKALNKSAFDTIPYLSWSFAGRRDYFWDKTNSQAIISWGENKVIMDLDNKTGLAYSKELLLNGDEKQKLIEKAWSNWCNDSFWMIAPFKMMDPGTIRSIVNEEDQKGLLVEYQSGGVTPGDSYLWLLDDNNIPSGYKMWTQILPVKGAYSSWEDWKNFDGALLSTMHKSSAFDLEMKNVKSGNDWKEFGFDSDPFMVLK